MAIKISGSTIIDDSRVVVNADKIGIGAASPNFDLEILSGGATGIAVSATSTQTTDTNKALRVFNNSGTVNFGVSYRGRVDASEYYGIFKGSIDSGVVIENANNANKIQIHHNATNSLYNIPFISGSQSDNSYQDLQYDNSDSLQYNPNTGRLRLNSSDGLDALTIRTTSNSSDRGIAFQESGNNYNGYIGMEDAGSDAAHMVFGVDNTNNSNVDSVEERLRITTDGRVGINDSTPTGQLHVRSTSSDTPIALYVEAKGAPSSGSGANNIGLSTVLFESNVHKRPELRLDNIHNGNWHESTGNTQHWRILWTASRETSQTPEAVELKPTVVNSAGGGFAHFRIRVTDTVNGLVDNIRLRHTYQQFYINGSKTLENTTAGLGVASTIFHISDDDTKIEFPSSDTITASTNGSERLRIKSDGKIGIGVNATNPSFQLQIHESVNTAYAANATVAQLAVGNVNSSSATNAAGIHLFTDGNGRGVVNLSALNNSTNASADFVVQTRHSGTIAERLRILSNGRVGIGSDSPEGSLDIFTFTNTSASDTGTTLLRLTNHVGSNSGNGDVKGLNGQRSYVDFTFRDTNANYIPQVRIGAQVGTTSGSDTGIAGEGSGNFVVYTATGTNNAGAGTLSQKLRVTNDGKVQLSGGTLGHLQIDNNGEFEIFESNTSLTMTNSSKIAMDFDGNVARLRSSTNGTATIRPLGFFMGAVEKVRITPTGDLNIGGDYSQSTFKLQVTGNAKINGNLDVSGTLTADIEGSATQIQTQTRNTNAVHYLTFVDADNSNATAETLYTNSKLNYNPNTNEFTLSASTSGDAKLIIEADTDNNNEADNPRLVFKQDGGIEESVIGMNFSDTTGTGNNQLFIANSVSDGAITFLTGGTNGYTNASERMRITDGGLVGIGTNDPTGAQKLNVYADSTGTGGILQITQDGTGDAAIDFQLKGTREYTLGIDNSDSDKFKLSSTAGLDSDAVLIATTDGLIGIGEENPKAGLSIRTLGDYSTNDGNTYWIPEGQWSTVFNFANDIISNRDYWVGFAGGYHQTNNSVNISLAPNRGNFNAQQGMYISGEGTAISTTEFAVGKILGGDTLGVSTEASTGKRATKSELFRIKSDGKVGITTNNPLAKLDVRGTVLIADDIGSIQPSTFPASDVQLMVYTSTTGQPITNTNCARILIATDAKNTGAQGYNGALDFGNSDATAGQNSNQFNYRVASIMSNAAGDTSSTQADGDLQFWTKPGSGSLTQRLTITSAGSVNIGGSYGQTSRQLKVTGDAEVTGTLYADVEGSITPTGDLTIPGNLQVNGNTTLGNATSDSFTINATPTIINDSGLFVKTSSNAPTNGAQIRFTDQSTGGQIGHIRYKHSDGSIAPGSNDGFIIGGSENLTVVKVEGRVLVDEKVGINTNSARTELDVYGNINFQNNALISNFDSNGTGGSNIDHIWHSDAANYGRGGTWNFVSDGSYKDTGNSTLQMGFVNCSGGANFGSKVGIGATNPYYNLQVNFNNANTSLSGGSSGNWGGNGIRIENDNSTVGAMALIQFRVNTAEWHIGNKFISSNPDKSNFIFFHEGTEKVRITSDGDLLRGGSGQDIGASDGRWGTGYFDTINATNLTGTVSSPGSDTQVLFNDGGSNIGADAGLTYIKGSDKLVVAGQVNTPTLFLDESSGSIEKITQSGGSIEVYADSSVKFIESDNTTLMFEFDVNTTNGDARIILENDTNTYFNHPNNDQLGFTVGGTDTLRLRPGNVGINETNPSAGDLATGDSQNAPVLHVKGSGGSATGGEYNLLGRFEAGGDANDTGAMIALNHSNDRGLALIGGRGSSNRSFGAIKSIDNIGRLTNVMTFQGESGQGVEYIKFYTGDSTTTTERLRIDSTGRVLVNTTTTNNGNNKMIIEGPSPSGTYAPYDGQLVLKNSETSGAVDTGSALVFFGHDGGNQRGSGAIRCLKENGTSGNHNFYMSFLTRVNGGSNTEKLRITSGGSVNIGGSYDQTTRKLYVDGDAQVTGTLYANIEGGISPTGNVTIGGNLIVNGNTTLGNASSDTLTVNATTLFQEDVAIDSDELFIAESIKHLGDTNTSISFPSNDTITFTTSGSERLRITSDGRIGINKNGPNDYELDIQKRSTADDVQMRLYNDATGSSSDTVMRFQIGGTSASNYIYFGDSGDSNSGMIEYDHSDDSMSFTTGAFESLRINSDGRMKLGQAGPILLEGDNEYAFEIFSDIRNSNADQVYALRINMDDDDTSDNVTGDRERGSAYFHFDGNSDQGNTSEELRIRNIHSDVNCNKDYDEIRGMYSDIDTNHNSGTITASYGVIADNRHSNSGAISSIYGFFTYARATTDASGNIGSIYAYRGIARQSGTNTVGNTGNMYGGRFESQIRYSTDTRRTATNAYGVYSLIYNDNVEAPANVVTGTSALFYGIYGGSTTTQGINNPYGLYIHANAPSNYIGGNLQVVGVATVGTLDAGNITGTISAAGSNTQVLFNDSGNVGADSGLTFNKSTDKLSIAGDTSVAGTLFLSEASGAIQKIVSNSGDLDLYADASVRFFESDNNNLMFEFDVNTTNGDARIILEDDTDTYFNHPAANTLAFTTGGTERLRFTSTGAFAIGSASAYGTSGQVLKSNGNAAPSWVTPSSLSGLAVDVKQYKVGTTERTCPPPISVNNNVIGIGSTSNAYGNRYIGTSTPSGGSYCDGDIWYDTSGSEETATPNEIVEATKFFQNPTSLTETTIFPNAGTKNGGVFGPYTIASGITLTISSGSTFTII